MWLSLNIINTMVDLTGIDPADLAHRITMSTAEIESVEPLNHHFMSVQTARVLEVTRHPNADKLTLVDLETAAGPTRVVCGATNHRKNDIVALATPGTVLGNITIAVSKIRGEESRGMLCSARELGLSNDHDGIIVFAEGTPVGVPLCQIYPDWVDTRLEIDNKSITHRPDLWSHVGFAREIGALLGRPMKDPVAWDLEKDFPASSDLSVTIDDPAAAPRYSGLVMTGIRIGESPDWLKARVTSIGMRPINNIVDVTNYVMAEIGEPMHAFDRKKLTGGEIIVRLAKKDETITTLDGRSFNLSAEDIVIADRSGPVALAGVMGGGNSEIEEGTTDIVLEAATFNPVNIRKTAHRFNQRTEAAIRFEKSLSPELTRAALVRCYDLIRQIIPGSRALSPIIDAYPAPQERITIRTTTGHIRRRLGESISDERIIEILRALDFGLVVSGESLVIDVPHYRATKDISIPEDIIEEVGRIFGYDNISPVPPLVPCTTPRKNDLRLFERQVKQILTGHHNMIEVSGYSFVGEALLNRLGVNEDRELRLSNPLSVEHDRLRRSLMPSIITAVEYNQRFQTDFRIYEMGRVYLKDDRRSPDLIVEETRLTGAIYDRKPATPIFYDAKAVVRGVLEKLGVKNALLTPASTGLPPYAHPGRAMMVSIDGSPVGLIAEIHPETADRFEIRGRTAIFDLSVGALFSAEKMERVFRELQKFPEVPFELTVVTSRDEYTETLLAIIRNAGGSLVVDAGVITIYEGSPIPAGSKSVSIRVVFAAPDRTLSPEDVDRLQQGIMDAIKKKGYTIR